MNLLIRKMEEKDIEPLYVLLSDQQVMQYLEAPYSKEKAAQFLKKAGLSDPPLIFSVEEEGTFIGYVIYHTYDKDSMEIGWVLLPEYWGKGYASELTRRLIDKAVAEEKDVIIECSSSQEITKHIALKYGFSYEGKENGLEIFRLRR